LHQALTQRGRLLGKTAVRKKLLPYKFCIDRLESFSPNTASCSGYIQYLVWLVGLCRKPFQEAEVSWVCLCSNAIWTNCITPEKYVSFSHRWALLVFMLKDPGWGPTQTKMKNRFVRKLQIPIICLLGLRP